MKNESKSNQRVNRRRFAGILAGTGALVPALIAQEATPPAGARPAPPPQNQPPTAAPNPNTSQQRRGTMDEIPPFKETLTFTRSNVAPKVQPFPMTQVRVLGGPYKQAQDWNRGYMQRLSADRLTRNFLLTRGYHHLQNRWEDGSRILRDDKESCADISRATIFPRQLSCTPQRAIRKSRRRATRWLPISRKRKRSSRAVI